MTYPYHLEGNTDRAEDLFGPHIPCLSPDCKQLIPVKSKSPYCSDRCRIAHKLKRFIDEGEVS